MGKKVYILLFMLLLVLVVTYAKSFVIPPKDSTSSNTVVFKKVDDVPLSGGTNRWDYQSINNENNRLYLSHLGSNQLVVFDLKEKKIIKNIPLIASPFGVLAIPELHKVYTSLGGNNTVAVIDEQSLEVIKYITVGDTPDGIGYDPITKKLFVTDENGGAISVIDTRTDQRVTDIIVGGSVGNTHFDLISKDIFTVSGNDNTLVEVNTTSLKIVNEFDITGCSHPHGFYIDESMHTVFITCQDNNKIIVYDLNTKKIIYTNTVGENPDVLAYDPGLHYLYVASESGYVSLFQIAKKNLVKIAQLFIADGAHSISVDKNTHMVYIPLENVNGKPVLRIMQPSKES